MVATGWRRIFCALVLSTIVLIALHSHAFLDPLDDQPINGGHHCLLCIAAHLPQAVSSSAEIPLLPNSSAVLLASSELGTPHEAQLAFSLYMRPPPAL
jgi:hypothetical protein